MKIVRVFEQEDGSTTRQSGNGCFPAPSKKDIGREVVVKRKCMTWDGFLGWFADDKDKTTYAFWNGEMGRNDEVSGDKKAVEMARWGKDHWSTFAYAETLAVENNGLAIPDLKRMRCSKARHPHLMYVTAFGSEMDGAAYLTRLKDGELTGHDDWDCLDDAVAEGLLKDVGSRVSPAYTFTDKGKRVAAELRQFKMSKEGNFHDFVPSEAKA